jgi:hypothetical protein
MMRTTPRTALAVAAMAAALCATTAGCGDDDAEVSTDTISEVAWTDQVNELCTAHNDALGAIIGPLFAAGPPAPDDAQTALDEIVERTRRVTGDIDALAEPSALTIHVAALVAALDAGSDRAEALGGPGFFSSSEDPFRRAADIAGELGLAACDTEG